MRRFLLSSLCVPFAIACASGVPPPPATGPSSGTPTAPPGAPSPNGN